MLFPDIFIVCHVVQYQICLANDLIEKSTKTSEEKKKVILSNKYMDKEKNSEGVVVTFFFIAMRMPFQLLEEKPQQINCQTYLWLLKYSYKSLLFGC